VFTPELKTHRGDLGEEYLTYETNQRGVGRGFGTAKLSDDESRILRAVHEALQKGHKPDEVEHVHREVSVPEGTITDTDVYRELGLEKKSQSKEALLESWKMQDNVTKLLQELRRKGYIERRREYTSTGSWIVYTRLTEKGKKELRLDIATT